MEHNEKDDFFDKSDYSSDFTKSDAKADDLWEEKPISPEELEALDWETPPGLESDEKLRQAVEARQDSYGTQEWQKEPVTEEEWKALDENDPGYVSDRVLSFTPKYNDTGIHDIQYDGAGGIGAVEGTVERTTLQPPENGEKLVLMQYEKPGHSGRYFAELGTNYEELQLPEIEDKRQPKYYEVVKPLEVEKSRIGYQSFHDYRSDSPAVQYTTEHSNGKTAEQLVKEGYLREMSPEEIAEIQEREKIDSSNLAADFKDNYDDKEKAEETTPETKEREFRELL